jgi:hypothetical protein
MKEPLTKQKTLFIKGLLETILVIYVSSSMFLYGVMKFAQFGHEPYSDKIVGNLTNMELMWAFYGRTLSFPIIIGIFEILGAGLLFFIKTRVMGCFLLTTILTNIIIQDIIYDVHSGALISAIIYQIIILYLMWIYRPQIYSAFKTVCQISPPKKLVIQLVHIVIGLAISILIKLTLGL